ncbi:MAG: amino acid adenylation domain-containing protein, partial [bacterium]|nr:amino acid adenylation domain-containing protein [bacterium]
ILPEEEKQQILYKFNDTAADYPREKTIHQLFAQQVEKTPDSIALTDESLPTANAGYTDSPNKTKEAGIRRLTYRKLDAQALRVARFLLADGMETGSLTALKVERSVELIIGILGILKAGGAYLPIATDYPAERVRYMLEDSSAGRLLINRPGHMQKAPTDEHIAYEKKVLYIEDILSPATQGISVDSPPIDVTASDIAYVIYTSGSTGRPKGVAIEHRGIANFKTVFSDQFEIGDRDNVLQFASISFDASVSEIFMALLNGAALHVPSMETLNDTMVFQDYLESNNITVATLPPPYVVNLDAGRLSVLRILITAGSSPNLDFIKKCAGLFRYINAYGPTEDSICSSFLEPGDIHGLNTTSIGKPIANKQAYIVDNNMKLQPIGVPGELCVSGAGVARGYLNRPELTAQQFVPVSVLGETFGTPASPATSGRRLYKTGDLARWLPDGNIEFLGRIDFQVKIRGFRIEPGEIEAQLTANEAIKEAAVTVRGKDGEKNLFAYFVPTTPTSEDISQQVRETLGEQLPSYMIPAGFIQMESLPLTTSGKVDTGALPTPAGAKTDDSTYVPPADEVEEILAGILSDVLGLDRISVFDNFFTSGGDSIKAMQVTGRLQKHRLNMTTKDFPRHPTIRGLRPHITTVQRQINQEPVSGNVPLTPIQEWFYRTNRTPGTHFNQAVMLYRPEGIDRDILENVFRRLIIHHDALRMVYHANTTGAASTNEPGIQQFNRAPGPQDSKAPDNRELFLLEEIDLLQREEKEINTIVHQKATHIQTQMDPGNGPLVRLGLFRTDTGDHLLVVVHHLVVDGVSWRILMEDISTAYTQCLQKKDIRLPEKTDSFQYWSRQLTTYAAGPQAQKEVLYWNSLEEPEPLPRDYEAGTGNNTVSTTDSCHMVLNETLTGQLSAQANRAYSTEINHLLLAALSLAVKDWCGITRISLNLEGHGREQIIPDVNTDRTVGWFTSQFPVILETQSPSDTDVENQLSHHIIC